MVKKISYIIISVAIVVAGYIALEKLNFWERSVWIFKTSSSQLPFEGRSGRGRDAFDGRPVPGNRPEFNRQEGRYQRFERGGRREIPDSIRQQLRSSDRGEMRVRQQSERFESEDGRHGRGEFQRGKKVYLKNVIWFTLAFSFFTLIVLYLDRAYCFVINHTKKSG